jgi:hypothetical protein
MVAVLISIEFIFNPDYVLDFVMKLKRAKKLKMHGNFFPQV